jgi:hypothetical protein
MAFDAGGIAVKAAIYDERGGERAVVSVAMAPMHPAPCCLERDPETMWSAVCEVGRRVLTASWVEPDRQLADLLNRRRRVFDTLRDLLGRRGRRFDPPPSALTRQRMAKARIVLYDGASP